MGGVLYIDKACTLLVGEQKDFWTKTKEELMRALDDHPDPSKHNPVIIFAGYKREMEGFMKSNPELTRRLNHQLHFKDYSCVELAEIVDRKLLAKKMKFPIARNCNSSIVE